MSSHGHHGHHGGHSNFVNGDFGEQMAAGGAAKFNSKRVEYWDKWILRNSLMPFWQFGFLIVCFLIVALFPVVVDHYLASQTAQRLEQLEQSQNQPAPQFSQGSPPVQTQPEQAQFGQEPTGGYDNRFGRAVTTVDR